MTNIIVLFYAFQELSPEIWWFYMISLAFYVSMFISQCFDSRRRDLWHTSLQHCIIFLFLIVSWICNFYRVGIIVLLLHDVSDALIQVDKISFSIDHIQFSFVNKIRYFEIFAGK